MTIADIVRDYVSGLDVTAPVYADDLIHKVMANGFQRSSRPAVQRALHELGYSAYGRGRNAVWYRKASDVVAEEKKMMDQPQVTHWASLQERLEAEVAAGERRPCVHRVNDISEVPEPDYEFESSITTKKLKGKYGEYTVMSDGQIVVELLVSGTIVNDIFVELVRELNAVKKEMEAMANG